MLGKLTKVMMAATAIFAVIGITGPPPAAQTPPAAIHHMNCGERDSIVNALTTDYLENQTGLGLASPTTVLELFVGPEGSWTLIATMAGGFSCIIGIGLDWQSIDPAAPKVSGSGQSESF